MHSLGHKTNISNSDLIIPTGDRLQMEIEQKNKAAIQKQKDIINYNKNIYNIDPVFKTKQFTGNNVIVRLFRNDYLDMSNIPDIDNIPETTIVNILPSTKIEMETYGGKNILIDNPIDYTFKGVVIAFSPLVQEKSKETLGFQIEPGQTVELTYFDFPNYKYYTDKFKIDTKWSKDDLIAGRNVYPNFEGYFIITPFNIESLILNQ